MAAPKALVDVGDLALEVVDQHDRGGDVPPPRFRHLEPLEQLPPTDPEQVGDRARLAEVDQARVDPVLEHRAVLHQMQTKVRQLALLADPRVGQPDRRHQVAVAQDRQHPRVDLVGLAGQGSQALDLLGVGDLDLPALLLKRVVDQPGAGHRLDHRADRLTVDLVDPTGQPPQRVAVRWRGQLVQLLSRLGEQTHVDLPSAEIQPGVQH
ncbi:MAG: hypothetical protein ACRDM7_22635 [Thermoleophilaceae bacterium]